MRGDVPLGWRRWAHATLTPKVDYMATIRHVVRRALRDSTLGRYDRTYRRPHRRQSCYGEFIMPTFYQPRPRPGSSSTPPARWRTRSWQGPSPSSVG